MAKYLINQNSFRFGEVSPEIQGRRDLEEYKQSLETLENFIVQPTGGVSKRPGFRHVKDLSGLIVPSVPQIQRPRLIPFIFSKEEKYMVMMPSHGSASDIAILKSDGTEATIGTNHVLFVSGNDAKKWHYAQSGDILILTYNDPLTENWLRIPPVVIVRDRFDVFNLYSVSHPSFNAAIKDTANFNHAVYRPYLNPNVDGNKNLFVDNVAIGGGRVLYCQDKSANFVPLFTPYHVFTASVSLPTQIGAYFRITKGSTTGVVFVTGLDPVDTSIAPANINTATNILTHNAHGYNTGDIITADYLGTPPTITGYSDWNGDQFHIRVVTGNTYTLHPTYADAISNTNILDFTAAGDGIRINVYKVSQCDITVEVALEGTLINIAGATDNWQESAWSAWQGFPRTVTFYHDRAVYGGNRLNPDALWWSQNRNIYNMMQTRLAQDSSAPTAYTVTHSQRRFVLFGNAVESDPFFINIASNEANPIKWLSAKSVLAVGTDGAEYIVAPVEGIISALKSPNVSKQTTYGSLWVQPAEAGESIFFVSRDGRRIRDFKFNDTNGSFISNDITFFSKHIVFRQESVDASTTYKGATFTEMYYQPSRSRFWMLTSNDQLVGCTYAKESGTVAWDYHPLNKATDGISSLCVLPADNDSVDNLFAIVQRGAFFYLCRLGDDFEHPHLVNESSDEDDVAVYCDFGGYQTLGSTTNVVTGLSYLEDMTLQVIVNGIQETNKKVVSGQITLDATYAAGTKVVFGMKYTSKLQTLDIEGGGFFGTSDSTRQRQDRISLRLNKSRGGKYGNHLGSLTSIEYTDPNGTTNNSIFTGIKRLDLEITPDMENKIVIQHDEPLPFNLLSITHRGVSYE